MSANPPRSGELTGPSAAVHRDRLADNETIGDELANGLTGVGIGDFAHLIRVQPDLALSTTDHGGREAFLSSKIDPVNATVSVWHANWMLKSSKLCRIVSIAIKTDPAPKSSQRDRACAQQYSSGMTYIFAVDIDALQWYPGDVDGSVG